MGFKSIFLVSLLSFPVLAFESLALETGKDPAESQLISAIVEAEAKIGNLEPWQKSIYSLEIIPQFQRFIRDYHSSSSGITADIDFESIGHYLSFFGPKALKLKDPKILIFLKPDSSCAKCISSLDEINLLVRLRMERRGLVPLFVSPEELPSQTGEIKLEDQVLSLASSKNAVGALVVQWAPVPLDDVDSTHADEKRYVIYSFLKVGDLTVQTRKKELTDTDSFEVTEARLLTDIFTDLGMKLEVERASSTENGKEEILIDISGIQNYMQYIRIKTTLETHLKDVTSFEDRMFAKGRVVFSVYSNINVNSIRKQVIEMSLDSGGSTPLTVVVR